MIDQRPVYSKDGQLIFYVNTSNQVTGYVQGHLVAKKQLREESELISQSRAVTLLYQYNEIPNNSKIEWANLGYTRLLSTDEGAVYVPTWVINLPLCRLSQDKRAAAGTSASPDQNGERCKTCWK